MNQTTLAKRIITLVCTALCITALAGCGTTDNTETPNTTTTTVTKSECTNYSNDFRTCTITMPDTRRVTCIYFHEGYAGGLSCDWNHADGADQQ
ncbi:hypothetical protein KIH79_06825 [Bifidobacterium sp. 82T10]|uniref:Lipoprotein n=1 Tax=Bifidobacterium miconis TaxID=2834435 RepID=A0ABS6WF39_9BIFI|nr:hypothetical protein [Bifidobacterium miconis]MBW3092664.1 hypothetical protein [Bifidobacterium miconis]